MTSSDSGCTAAQAVVIAAARVGAIAFFGRLIDDAVTAEPRQVVIDRVGADADRVVDGGHVTGHRACAAGLCLRKRRTELALGLLETAGLDSGSREDGFRTTLRDRGETLSARVDFRGDALVDGIGTGGGDRRVEDE